MSFRSRARRLQKAKGIPYQEALATIRAHADEAARLAETEGWSLTRADLVLAGVSTIEVLEVPEEPPDPLQLVLDRLRAQAAARAVFVTDRRILFATSPRAPLRVSAHVLPDPRHPVSVEEARTYTVALRRPHTELTVYFDETTSLGLVQLRVAAARDEVDRLLAERDRRSSGVPPLPGASSPSGVPAEAALSVAALRRRKR